MNDARRASQAAQGPSRLQAALLGLVDALRFLTILPLPHRFASLPPAPERAGHALLSYPLAGLLIGLLLTLIHLLLAHLLDVHAGLQAALLLAAWVIITGALHLDGLADTADAWLGGHGDPARTLAIMQDPRSGPVGVVAVVLVLQLKLVALALLLEAGHWPVLLFSPVLSRTLMIVLLRTTPYVRPGGLGSALAQHLPRGAAWQVSGLTAAALAMTGGWRALVVLLVVAALFIWLRHLLCRRIGGTTGDTAGALLEIAETAALVVWAVLS